MEHSPLLSTPSFAQRYMNLSVGGTYFTTSLETLTRYPGSTLHSMFSKEKISTAPRDEEGRNVIDRDGGMFGFILNFLRSGNLNLPTDFTAYEQLKDEVEYFQLADMETLLITRVEGGEKQRVTLLNAPNEPRGCTVVDVFKIEEQYFRVAWADNDLWRNTVEILRRKAMKIQEPNSQLPVYSLHHCSPMTFQFVIDYCNGKKSFIPKCKHELEPESQSA